MGRSNNREKYAGQGSPGHRSSSNSNFVKACTPNTSKKTSSPFFNDPLLIPRINQYLSDNKDKVYVDINDMVSELQSQYRDYARRKRNAFKPLVERAFSFVLQQCGISQGEDPEMANYDESSEKSSSDVEECNVSDGDAKKTSSNSQLVKMYNPSQLQAMSKQYQACSNNENAELIDLSSDDEQAKKKEGSEDKGITAVKLNKLQNRIGNKETTLTVIRAGAQNHTKSDRPHVTITAKRSRDEGESKSQGKSAKKMRSLPFQPKTVTFADFGGDPKVLEEVCKLVLHISHPEIFREIGVSSPRGFLLHGPPGCGKTLLAHAIAGELGVELIQVSAPELVGGMSGESEERIRDLFTRAVESAPCALFIDEVDVICPNRQNAQKEMERRIVAQLLTCLDELGTKPNGDLVLVIGATNRPDSMDPALRRAGRFDREVCIGIPDLKAREKILRVLCSDMNLSPDICYEEVAQDTPGFVGADLLALTREAALVAINRAFGMLETLRNKDKRLKNKKAKADKSTGHGSNETKEREEEPMEVDEVAEPKKASESEPPSESQGSGKEKTAEEKTEKVDSGKVGNESEGERKERNEETKEVAEAEGGESKAAPSKEPEGAAKEDAKSDEEVDLEVISENSNCESPSLDTLLHWLRDSTPLPARYLKNVCITKADFQKALRSVQPSAKREGFATVPDVTWDDVGSLSDVREELKMFVLGPVKFRKVFEQLGLTAPAGVLIWGPPGCGKTLLAKAIANEAGINFISVKGPELLNMYVGESERAVRRCFQRAKNSAPCVIFFDELDALCPKRSSSTENLANTRVVNQLLTEMDGVEDRKGVYLMAATNRPDIIDPAVLRPGRLDKLIYVGLPKADDRVDILKAITKNGMRPKLGQDVDLCEIGRREQCEGYSGADLSALVYEAGVEAVKEVMSGPKPDPDADVSVRLIHFERALEKIRPSVLPEVRKFYETMKHRYGD